MEKIKILLQLFESNLNKLLLIGLSPILFLIKKIKPFLQSPYRNSKSFIFKISLSLKTYYKSLIDKINGNIGPRAYEFYKLKFQFFINQVKQSSQKSTLSVPKVIFLKLNIVISEFIQKMIDKIGQLSPGKFGLFGILFLVAVLNAFHLLSQYRNLSLKVSEENLKTKKALESPIDRIPSYYNNLARTSSIKSLKVPAQVTKTSKIKALELDVYVMFYKRSSKKFFDKNMMVFIDHLEMSIEPILPSFPLSPEGKNILREKISREINLVFNKGKNINQLPNSQGRNIASDNIKNNSKKHEKVMAMPSDEVEEIYFTNLFAN